MHAGAITSPIGSSAKAARPGAAALRTALWIAAIGVFLAGWQNADRVVETILYVWHQVVLPAFQALLISGLGLCS